MKENQVAEKIEKDVYQEIDSSLGDRYEVVLNPGRHKSSFGTSGSSYIPDIGIVRKTQKIPSELRDVENLKNFFPDVGFGVPVVGIELKYRANIPHRQFKTLPRGPPPHEGDKYPGIFLVCDNSSVEPLRKTDWVIITDITETESIRKAVVPEIKDRLSNIEDDFPEVVEHMDEYIEDFRAKIYHFSEVLRGYRKGQTGALVVLLSAFFESYCYTRLEEYVRENRPNDNVGMFLEEDDRMEVLFKSCRFFEIIEESEYNTINQIKNARNAYAHDLAAYDTSGDSEISESDIESAIRVYEDMTGVEKSMTDTN
jgi:hypothetical protein